MRAPACLGAIAAVLFAAAPLCAQSDPLASAEWSAAENDALRLYRDNKPVAVRRQVEQILEAQPDAILAHFLLGAVARESEGDLGLAMYHLGRARELYETRWSVAPPSPGAPWRFHRELLYEIEELAQELELPRYRKQVLEYYNALYEPDLAAQYAWTLMALGDEEAARQAATTAASAREPRQRSLGLNTLCAIETEAGARQKSFEACGAAFANAEALATEAASATKTAGAVVDASPVTVHAYNAAEAALGVLRFDEAERLARRGAERLEYTTANPWRLLAQIAMSQGKTSDALFDLQEMERWRERQPPYLRDQSRAANETVFATLLLLAGDTEHGLRLMERAIAQPDRQGLRSSGAAAVRASHLLLRRALLRARAERLAEEASWSTLGDLPRLRWAQAAAELDAVIDAERVRGLLSDGRRARRALRSYGAGGLADTPVFLLGEAVEVLGPGLSAALIASERRAGDEPQLDVYYEALAAEAAWRDGDEERARERGKAALAALPATEVLLRARVAALSAAAAYEDGDQAAAFALFTEAMQLDPGVVRRLRLALPASVEGAPSGAARAAAELLADSPRFEEARPGFRILVDGSDAELSACLLTPAGAQLACGRVSRDKDESQEAFVARLCRTFHDQAFGIPVSLATVDLASLDGTVSSNRQAARRLFDETLQRHLDEQQALERPKGGP